MLWVFIRSAHQRPTYGMQFINFTTCTIHKIRWPQDKQYGRLPLQVFSMMLVKYQSKANGIQHIYFTKGNTENSVNLDETI